jgi:hypothetical protein
MPRRSNQSAGSRCLLTIDTIQELSDILALDSAGLGDLGAGDGHLVDVIAAELDLILHIGRAHIGDSLWQGHFSHPLLSQEIADLHHVAGQSYVDGEMGIAEAHLVQEALRHTSDEVLDVRAHSSDARKLDKEDEDG